MKKIQHEFKKNYKIILIYLFSFSLSLIFSILKGLGEKLNKTRYIYFEHHFDDMINKEYTFTNIHDYLTTFNFRKVFKVKMAFRKSFEYIYKNNDNSND